ncbi:MAG TPA: DUF4126 domain-containing protein [Thermoleophilia bacterium]|nr:DUF4126 domain-containing protein [Thermoleophilia bacterium]
MIELLLAGGRVAGLGTSAGIRPSLTLAVIGMMHHLHAGTILNPVFSFLGHWQVIVIFIVLAIVESGLDKIPTFDRVQGRLTMPYRVVMGGIAGAATVPFGWWGIAIGGGVAAALAWFALHTKQGSRPKTVASDAALVLMSMWEDLASFATAMLTLAFSPFGYLAVVFTSVVYWRTRYLRRAKYRRMQRRSVLGTRRAVETSRDKG